MTMIERETFLKLPTEEVAKLVRAAGPQVCVFPINGTRRWFMLEHNDLADSDHFEKYLSVSIKRHVELCGLMFDHGIDTLLTPVFGSELLTRGDEYTSRVGIDGLVRTATDPLFLEFFKKYKVRVRFYGDYRKKLQNTLYAYSLKSLDKTTKLTKNYDQFRLFFGVFANDATETLAELSVLHFQTTGRIPSREELTTLYYGVHIEPVTLFIGFGKFNVFDYPLLSLGEEDLYFSVSPSPYITPNQLRKILYDHIYSRGVEEEDYAKMSKQDFLTMRNFYIMNKERTLGIGEHRGGIWYPLPEMTLPTENQET